MKQNTKLTLKFYAKTVRRHWFLALLGFIGVTGGAAGSMILPLFFKSFVDALALGQHDKLMHLLIVITVVSLVEWAFWRLSFYSMSVVEARGMKEIADTCFEALHRHSFNFFNNQFVGSLVKRVGRMVRSFEDVMDKLYYDFYTLFLRIVILVVVFYIISPWLGLATFAWVCVFVTLHLLISNYKMLRYDLPKSEADTRVTARLADTVSNNAAIKLFAQLPYEKKEFGKVGLDWTRKTQAAWFYGNHVESIQGLFMIGLDFLILYVAIGMWVDGELTIGHFVLLQTYLFELFAQLWSFERVLRHFFETLADAEEMTVILQTPFEVLDKPGATKLRLKKGEVRFENVSFSYNDDEENSVVRNLSFDVKAGERIALIGPSGGGKTTVMKLLLRLFDLDEGKILIDGQDIAHHTQDSLRSQIALVPQDPALFHRSLMENIRYGNLTASDAEVIKAAKLAHCHEFISRFSKGYKTLVGERGVKLSGGERQRVAIARALLADTKILILDEATSSLDSESEKLIKDAMKVLMKKKTVFVIAHRLSTIVDMDRIMVLEKGAIVEEGLHHDLVKKEGGLYKKLWDLQVGGYLD